MANNFLKKLRDEQPPSLAHTAQWEILESSELCKRYTFPDFLSGLEWINTMSVVAEEEDHHPDVFLSWGRVELRISTHAIGGLSENDFILAAKLDECFAAFELK